MHILFKGRGISNFKYKKKNEMDSDRSSEMINLHVL